MKKMLSILALAAVAVGCNNHRVVITGEITGVEDGVIYLAESGRNGALVDSTEIKGASSYLHSTMRRQITMCSAQQSRV